MMPYAGLSQKINEVFEGFLRYYPSYQEFRKEILELTEKHISQSLAAMSEDTLNDYFFGHQLHADITVEITKNAMDLKELSVPVRSVTCLPYPPPPSVPPATKARIVKRTAHFNYEKQGNIIFLPQKYAIPLGRL
ncbi:MAG: hypothetical protein AB7E31_14325 [Desulfitobacterium sp.]